MLIQKSVLKRKESKVVTLLLVLALGVVLGTIFGIGAC